MNNHNYPIKSLIDPTAQVINPASSTRALKLIHRSLLSHLMHLAKNKGSRIAIIIQGESWETEFNSTAQLAEDLGTYIKNRPDA